MSHLFHYRDYVIIYEDCIYHIAEYPEKKFVSVKDVCAEIDKVEMDKTKNEPNGPETEALH